MFQQRDRREEGPPRVRLPVQRIVRQPEIVQIVGDERMVRPEPGLVDGGGLLQQRQRLGGPSLPQVQVGELRQAARRVEPVGAVLPAVLRQGLGQHGFGLVELRSVGQHRAERAQRLRRSAVRVAAGDRHGAAGPALGRL